MVKVGDIVKIPDEEDWGYILREDEKNFWIHWFISDDDNPAVYRYSKHQDGDKFEVV